MRIFCSSNMLKVLWWIETWWLWRLFENIDLIVMFKKPGWDISFMTWHVILQDNNGMTMENRDGNHKRL